MKKSLKRFLPFVIVLALCMSLFTVSAFATDKRNPDVVPTEDGKGYKAVDEDGNTIRNGWVNWTPDKENPKESYWVYASKGELVTGWHNIDGDWYYFNENADYAPLMYSDGLAKIYDGAAPETSQQWRDAKDFWWFNKDGSLYSGPSGWVSQIEYVDEDTTARVWYFVNSDGSVYKGFVEDAGEVYGVGNEIATDPALPTDGPSNYHSYAGAALDAEYYGFDWQDAPHFFTNKDGSIARNEWASALDTDPKTGETHRYWYYADNNGVLATGWKQIDGKWYFFGSTNPDRYGYNDMREDTPLNIDGKWYRVDKSGARVEGWFSGMGVDKDGNPERWWEYYEPGTGVAFEEGWKKIDGKWYYFEDYGMVANEWAVSDNGTTYYLGGDGAMVTGWQQDDAGEWYNFGTDGVLKTDTWIQEDNGAWYYVDADGEMVRNDEVDGFYLGSDGAWIPD